LCGSGSLVPVLDLGAMDLTGRFPVPDEECPKVPLMLVKCMHQEGGDSCGLVQLRHTTKKEELFGKNYGYRSGLNASMEKHLEGIVLEVLGRLELNKGDKVLDIGCNDGTLLRFFHQKSGNIELYGIDPLADSMKDYYSFPVTLKNSFFHRDAFSEDVKRSGKFKIITTIAMFYDLDAPLQFAAEIESHLADDGLWVVELGHLEAMVKQNSYDTICHEHLGYYSLSQFVWLAQRTGLKIIDVSKNDINGGSIRLTLAKKKSDYNECEKLIKELLSSPSEMALEDLEIFDRFQKSIDLEKDRLVTILQELKRDGKRVAGLGASTKGNVVLQYAGVTDELIESIGEVNCEKFGRVTPGSRINIVQETKAYKEQMDYFVVLPWHFREFFIQRESEFLSNGGKLIFPLPKVEVVSIPND
jgi:NDP-4-keto-2,6-dideoxyhexose 3-C-methyltransferase